MAGEIMAENFTPETLLAMSQMEMQTDAQIKEQLGGIEQQVQQMAARPDIAEMAAQNPEQAEQMKAQVQDQMQQLEQVITIDKVMVLLRE
jgi:aminopeptidase N